MISEKTSKFLHTYLLIFMVLFIISIEILFVIIRKYFIIINGLGLLFCILFYCLTSKYIYILTSSYNYTIQDDKVEKRYRIFFIDVQDTILTKDLYKIKYKTNILTFKYDIVSIILYNSSGSLKLEFLDKYQADIIYKEILETLGKVI